MLLQGDLWKDRGLGVRLSHDEHVASLFILTHYMYSCKWFQLWRGHVTRSSGTHYTHLRNVLADGLAQSGDFVKADARILEWDYRAPLILEEIVEAGIDIACLEEVNHFDDTLKPELAKLGYIGCFVPKTSSTCVELGFPEDG